MTGVEEANDWNPLKGATAAGAAVTAAATGVEAIGAPT